MKIKEGFIKHNIGEKSVVVATGELSVHFHGMIELNQSGSDIWDEIAKGADVPQIVETLSQKYEEDPAFLEADVLKLIGQMKDAEILEED